MKRLLLRARAHLRDAAKPVTDAAIGGLTIGLLRTTRYFDPEKTARFFGRAAHFIGRRLREDRIGRENLTAAFPEKSPEEIEEILTGVWHNLGRIGAEFAHIDRIWDHDPQNPDKPGRVEFSARSKQLFDQLRDDGKPALFFAAHLGNWELSPIAAAAHDVARPSDHEADFARGQRAEIFGRVEFAHIGPDPDDEIGGLLEVGLLGRVRIEAEIAQRRRQDVVGGIQHGKLPDGTNVATAHCHFTHRLTSSMPPVSVDVPIL